MGRLLVAGIPVCIRTYESNEDFDRSKLQKLYKKLSKCVSLDLYNHIEDANENTFYLKNITKEEIYKALQEFTKVTGFNTNFLLSDEFDDFKKCLTDNTKIKLIYNYEESPNNFVNGILTDDDFYYLETDSRATWLYYDCDLIHTYGFDSVAIEYIPIWSSFDKVLFEDETWVLALLNSFKIKNFENYSDLTKSILFFVTE